jgi:hypothetical protein
MDSLVIDGVELGPSTDFVSLLRRQLKYGSVWNEVGDAGPEEGLWRVLDEAAGTAIADRLLSALVDLMSDTDIQIRSSAVGFALDYAEKIDPKVLLSLLTKHPALYIGVKPAGTRKGSPDLAWTLRQAMAGHTTGDPDVIRYLRDSSRDLENGWRLLGGLALDDPDWTIQHSQDLVVGQLLRARAILAGLRSAPKREQFVRKFTGEPVQFRRALSRLITEKVKDPIESARLTAILQ